MMYYTVDRFEEAWAVLEDAQARTFQVPRDWLPAGAREGDVVVVTDERAEDAARRLRFELDPTAREQRLKQAQQLRSSLPKGPKGDISL